MLRFHNRFYWRVNRLRRNLLFVCILVIITTSLYYFDKYSKVYLNISQNLNEGLYNVQNQNSIHCSTYFGHERNKLNLINNIWYKEDDKSECAFLIEKCVHYLNKNLHESNSVTIEDHNALFKTIEQLRIYDYCFISGKLDVGSVLNQITEKNISTHTYYQRVFPYLNFHDNNSDLMFPTLYHITEKGKEIVPLLIDPGSIVKFNQNFWISWSNQFRGEGIIVTMSNEDVGMFKKLLAILKVLNNSLPLQIVTTGNDFDEETLLSFSYLANKYNQDIYVIDCSNILNKQFTAKHITGFLNKWIATLFSTFEEAILIDLDSVPYIPPEKFFDIASYKQTGIYMYRDREILVVDDRDACLSKFSSIASVFKEQSILTIDNIKSSFLDVPKIQNQEDSIKIQSHLTMEENVFQNFFQKGNAHQVDSGLIIVNRQKQLSSLLMGFALHLSKYFDDCIHGDKEFFWLGPLFATNDYSIDPNYAGTMGMLYKNEDKVDGICAAQIAHVNENNDLMWSNGGLSICKFKNAAVKDFKLNKEFFKLRYNDPESLQKIYNSPLMIDGVVIPDAEDIPWMQTRECNQFRFCAYFEEKSASIKTPYPHGSIIRFSQEKKDFYNNLAKIWSEN